MKKLLSILFATLALAFQAFAIPARPGIFTYTEPDGTVRRLERHGDEFFHWTTDAQTGQVVELDMAGYWRPAELDRIQLRQAAEFRRQANQYRLERNARPEFNFGVRRIPVILVEFTDLSFTVEDSRTKFDNLLNREGYADYQATGSVRDYFMENSHGQFTPVFEVFGPVKLPHEMAYYGAGDNTSSKAAQAVIDGSQLLDSEIDFSRYDSDNDGVVDMMLMYFAGYSEAEGGPEDAIWPHQWYVNAYKNVKFDGKILSRYFCTSELRGNKGSILCSIGATCHEFSHALGLPDFYDTNGEEDGTCSGLYVFSLMCSGCYNDNARTPPFFNAEERVMLGWMDPGEIKELPDGETRFGTVSGNVAYKSLTDVEGEYFLYECRDGSSWDSPLPEGMLAYHVDKSPLHSLGGIPCNVLWDQWVSYNNLNSYGNHPCFYVVPAAAQRDLKYTGSNERWVFPGSSKVTEFHPVDWEGNDSGVSLFNIRYDEEASEVSITVENHYRRELQGKVLSLDGKPLPGVYISLTEPGTDRRIRRKGSRSASRSAEITTGEDGSFVLDVKDFGDKVQLSALKMGYKAFECELSLLPRITSTAIRLRSNEETAGSVLKLYDEGESLWCMGNGEYSEMASSLFSASVLAPEGGRKVTSFQYSIYANTAKALYFIVDDASSGERLLTWPVDGFKTFPVEADAEEWVFWADVSDADFRIPPGKDLFIGYAVKDADYHYPFLCFDGEEGNLFFSTFDLEKSNWESLAYQNVNLLLSITLEDAEGSGPTEEAASLAELGINAIDPGKGVYKAGESFQLQLLAAPGNPPASVRWFWDGEETGAKSVTLTAGAHTVEARLDYADGSQEILELPVKVN